MIIYYLRKVLFIIAVIVSTYFTIDNIYCRDLEVSKEVQLLDVKSDSYYEMLSDNSGYTNINGLSNIKLNLIEQGYLIEQELITDKYIDIIATKEGEESYRIYFRYPEGYITFFSSLYENSYKLTSYINVR